MPSLFEKFASKSEKGTGIGLFLSKRIIEAHRGQIWGENNSEGRGATFTFTLPLADEHRNRTGVPTSRQTNKNSHKYRKSGGYQCL